MIRASALLLLLCAGLYGQTSEDALAKGLEAAVKSGGAEAGVRYLDEVLKREPSNEGALFFLSTARQATGDNPGCISLIEKPAAKDARLAGVLWTCYDGAGLTAKALTFARESAARFPDSAELHRWHGVSLMKSGDRKECIPIFERALRLTQGRDETSLYLLAQLYRMQRDPVASLFTYWFFLTTEIDGQRAAKARQQMEALFETRVLMEQAQGSNAASMATVPVDAEPSKDADLALLERLMGAQCGATSRDPKLVPERLAYCAASLLGDGLPHGKLRPMVREVFVPFLQKARDAKQLPGLSDVVLGIESPAARAFLVWQRRQLPE